MSDDLNFVLKARRDKLEALRAANVNPFGYSYARTHTASQAHDAMPVGSDGQAEPEGPTVAVAGRLVAWRAHGKTVFAHLADAIFRSLTRTSL